MNKTLLALSIVLLLLTTTFFTPKAAASQTEKINIFLDSHPLTFDVEPRMVSNRTLVPFRKLSESIGINVHYDTKTRKITANGNGKNVILTLDSKVATVNGKTVTLDAAAFTDRGRTLIPLRFFLEAFDATVNWTQQSREINIISPVRDMYTFSFYALGSFYHRQYIPSFDGMAYGWSAINSNGEFITGRWDNGTRQDYYWPEDHSLASTAEIIESGKNNSGEAFLMVAALEYNIIHTLVHDASKTDQAIAKMVDTAVNNNLNGILIDFEGIRNTDAHAATKKAFTAFIEKLSVETKKNGLKLSIALVPPNNAFNGYEYAKLGNLTDFIFLMAYDYHPRDGAHIRPEPLDQVNIGIELALQDIPKEKLVLGVNLVHETNTSLPSIIGLAKRHNLKGTGFWLLNQLDDAKISTINKTIQ